MGWDKLSQDFTLLGLSLAVFAVGLQYIPIAFFFRVIKHKSPTKEEVLMIRKILGIIAVLALIVVLWMIPKTIIDLSFAIADSFVTNANTTVSLWIRNTIAIEGMLIGFGLLILFALRIWKTSKHITIEKTDTEILIEKLDRLIDSKNLSDNVGTINKEIREYMKGKE
jgi:hypothetical protein